MMRFDPHDPKYWDKTELDAEMTRVFEICNGCRLCDNLCPTFTDLFDRIEQEDDNLTALGRAHDNPVLELTPADHKHAVDVCYQCKLCYPKCPYTPPHEYQLDFPRLLLRADAIQVRQKGKSFKKRLRDNFTGDADRIGNLSEKLTGLVNWANKNSLIRFFLEKVIGIHRKKRLPLYYETTFRSWYDNHPIVKKPAPLDRVALFYTCMVNNNKPWIGKQFVEILENHNIEVLVPQQECCGMPELGTGMLEYVYAKVDRNVKRLAGLVDAGYKIIVMSPSCSMMMRTEYALYATDKKAASRLQDNVVDPCEYLMQLHRKKELKAAFPVQVAEKITYHIPCHLKVQNIGFQSRDLLKLLPNTEVTTAQYCSGHDGTWSMKQEYYEISLDVGKKLFNVINREKPAIVASDCSLAHLHITEGTGEDPLHPIEILYQAMGLTKHSKEATV